MSVLQYNKKLK